jgi:hypothetical protein
MAVSQISSKMFGSKPFAGQQPRDGDGRRDGKSKVFDVVLG